MVDSAEELLLAEVASMYYEQDLTQEEIAKRIGVSRSGVSRLLTRSRELGLVQIQIRHPLQTSLPLQQELVSRFGLRDAQVLVMGTPGENPLPKLGMLAARYLDRVLEEGMTIGISWGTSMLQFVNALHPARRLRLDVVQLMGSISATSPDVDGPEIARRLAHAYGARCYYLHAPLLVKTAAVREALQQERNMRETFELMERMDVALVGVGSVRALASGLFRAGYLNEAELASIREQGAVGDVCGRYFDIHGAMCDLELHERIIGVQSETLRRVPLSIGVAGGVGKSEALLGAMRAGLVSVVITDEECAKDLLVRADSEPVAPPTPRRRPPAGARSASSAGAPATSTD